jgi:hypothetical protein
MSDSSTGTSVSHNNGMEGGIMGSRPIRCMCNQEKKKKKKKLNLIFKLTNALGDGCFSCIIISLDAVCNLLNDHWTKVSQYLLGYSLRSDF